MENQNGKEHQQRCENRVSKVAYRVKGLGLKVFKCKVQGLLLTVLDLAFSQ